MKSTIIVLTSLLLLSSFYSCIEKTNLTEEDLQWIVPYKDGDILIFQEVNSLKKDTTYISKKEIYHSSYNPISSTKILNEANIWYRNKNIRLYLKGQKKEKVLISILKFNNLEPVDPNISYLGFSYNLRKHKGLLEDISLVKVNRNFKDVFVFTNKKKIFFNTKDIDPQTLYWDIEYGIIKYETYKGEVWERINW